MRVIPYITYLLLISAHVVFLRDATAIFGVTINLPAMIVLLVALYKDDVTAAWFGFAVGLILAPAMPERMGWFALVTALLALIGCVAKEQLNLDSLKAKLVVILSGVFVHNVFVLIVSQRQDMFYLLTTAALPGAVYATAIAWLFFLFKEKKLSLGQIKEKF